MKDSIQEFAYNPHSPYSTPFTIISHVREVFTSKHIPLPCLYQVYCPYSCKKIKIGLASDNKIQALQFNTTTNRTVTVYADETIRYLVNKHRPNKKDKKTIHGQCQRYIIEVQDLGNVAIFNPYCIDPLNPLSFYTFSKVRPTCKPNQIFEFVPRIQHQSVTLNLGGKEVYLSKDLKWIGFNKYFDEDSNDSITITRPNSRGKQQCTAKTKQIITIANEYLEYYYGELQKIIQLETKQIQFNGYLPLKENIDEIYQNIGFYLNILEQVRARLMNDTCGKSYKQFFKEHPRLYSALQRLTSFLNYGNSKYNIVKLAELGFYNKSDMLQDLCYYELPEQEIPSAQEEPVSSEVELRRKLFPFARLTRGMPFPNVPLQVSLQSLHCQRTTASQIVTYTSSNPYLVMVDKQAKISLWSCEMMVHKMIQFDYSKDYGKEEAFIIPAAQNQIKVNANSEQSKFVLLNSNQDPANLVEGKEKDVQPDQMLLEQLQAMGYKTEIAKRALIQTKNAQISTVIDTIQQILKEKQKQKPKKVKTTSWQCVACTYINKPNMAKCEICQTSPPDQEDEAEKNIQKAISQEKQRLERLKKQEQTQKQRKAKEEQQRLQEQKKQKLKIQEQKRKRYQQSVLKAVSFYRSSQSNIDPFFISVLLQHPSKKSILRTFRIGLARKNLLKFYRIEENYIVSNFTRQVINNKDFNSINNLIGSSRAQIEWGIKFFEPSQQSIWTVINSNDIQLQGNFTSIKCAAEKIFLFNDELCEKSYEIVVNDDLNKQVFSLQSSNHENLLKNQQNNQVKAPENIQEQDNICSSQQILVRPNVQQICLQVTQYIPRGQWKGIEKQKDIKVASPIYAQNLIMSQFLPLKIQLYEGSIFSHKYSCTSMLEKSNEKNNIYISNYPNVSFAFKSIDNRPMLIETVTVVSKNVKMSKIYPISEGLIFTANELSWFTIAKQKFSNFTKEEYEEWLKVKQSTNSLVAFWQPVAYFQITNEVEFQINFKRIAKYIFLLPISVNKKDNTDGVTALKIDFFGVKGRLEQQIPEPQLNEIYKAEGSTSFQLQINQMSTENNWRKLDSEKSVIKSCVSASTFNFVPKFFETYANEIPLSITSTFHIKFKELSHQKQININSSNLKQIKILKAKQSKNNVQQLNIKTLNDLIAVQNKLSNIEIEALLNKLDLTGLMLAILKGPSDITQYENLLNKILNIHGFDKKILEVMSEILIKIYDPTIIVTDLGFKSYIRFYERLISLNEGFSKQTIESVWLQTITFCQQVRNKNYNILRNSYKIEQLVLQSGLFNKDYYRLINPNYVQQQKLLTITSQPQTPINNRIFVENITNFNYVYYIDTLGHKGIQSINFYFPKLGSHLRYKMCIKLVELNVENGKIQEKQIYYRYFHQDYLLQLSVKSFKDTEIYKKTHINYWSIPGELISPSNRVLKLYFDLIILTTITTSKLKHPSDPYIILPIINSSNSQQIKYQEHPLPEPLRKIFAQYPQTTKHNSSLERMPPHKFAKENNKLLYIIHDFKDKINEEVKRQSINKIQKIIQNILDKTIVTETVASIKINDFALNHKGLDFAYIMMITFMKIFRKLSVNFVVDVKIMFNLFDSFVVYECGPIKNQTSLLLTELYKRLDFANKNLFIETIINNYLIDSQKIRNLKISEKYPIEKIIKFLGEFNLPVAILFEKLRKSNSLSATTILVLLITSNQSHNQLQNLDLYDGDKVSRTFQVHQLIEMAFNTCIWVLNNSSSLSSELLELSLNLLLSLLTDKTSKKITPEEIKKFMNSLSQQNFWQLIFGTIRKKNDLLNEKIYAVFKILIKNITQNFLRGVNNILLEIIKKNQNSLYEKINPNVTDDARMNHLQTILQYLSLTNNKVFLDEDTAISLLSLPLTTTLWSLALKIIPRNDKILIEIIKKFPQEHYNTLGKEIMEFCEPLAGIRKLESNHINWLQLVRNIRLEGKSIFSLFIQKLRQCNFGGKNGLTMASTDIVKKLEVVEQFSKLAVEHQINQDCLSQENVRILIAWFFLNYSIEKGSSPATDLLFNLSKNVYKIVEKVAESPAIIPKFIRIVLEIRKQGQNVETLLEQKKLSGSNAMDLNRRFSECFEFLINLLCVNDELFNYFAFEIKGIQYLLHKAGLLSNESTRVLHTMKSVQGQSMAITVPEQEFLLNQGVVTSSVKEVNAANDKAGSTTEIKQEQFATNVQLVHFKNQHNITAISVDWTVNKKGNKTKIIFLPMNGPTHYEFPLYISLNQPCQVRSIKIGFSAASFEYNDKLIASPSYVLLEGGLDLKNLESMGEMEQINDDGYACNGIKVFVLNLQKIKNPKSSISDAIDNLPCHRVKYLKITVKRPVVSFIEGQFSPFNGKPYTNLGCSISFLSVLGDNFQKRKLTLLNSCKQISRTSALTILGTVINQVNPLTCKRISQQKQFVENFKNKFATIQEHIINYPTIVPNIVYSLGSSNEELGDWIIDRFLSQGSGDIQAKLLNQIVMSSQKRIYSRLDIFLQHVLKKVKSIISESGIQSNVKFAESVFFIESFCKTLEQSYNFGIETPTVLHCTFQDIQHIITLYDKKYSSPEIKTFSRLLISLLYLKKPLKLSQDIHQKALDLIWENCSQAKPYFYHLLGTLALNKNNRKWIQQNSNQKLKQLIADIKKSIDANSTNIINAQMYLLWILSFHESQYLKTNNVHLQLYNKIKNLVLTNFDVYENLMRLIQNVVLNDEQAEKAMAEQLISDVDLLVKRKDPNLQQLYVGILRLEKEININIKGFDVDSQNNKKNSFLASKILNKAQIKTLSQKINRKIKFNSILESDTGLKSEFYDKIHGAINASQLLIIIKFKLSTGKYGYFGCYSPGRAFRSQEDSYSWQDVINYEKGSFIFYISEGEVKFIQTTKSSEQMISLCGGEDEMDESLIFYDKNIQIMKLPFSSEALNNITLENFVGAQVNSIEVFNGLVKPSSMEPKFLASTIKAVSPFTYYRTSGIYVFPYRITIQKFINIIGIKGTCNNKSERISSDEILGHLSEQSSDFIADVEIQVEQENQNQKQEETYLANMRIFDKFSQLGGVNKVLEIGSQSIKDWQKQERRKYFEHYMSELRNFVHLPSFFNHYIKHQESITFLFEIASGMPDDAKSEKNWQQQEVKSSKYIYKILADIYKYDRSIQIRDMNKYSAFCELILQKLAQISKQTVRANKQEEETTVEQEQSDKNENSEKGNINNVKEKKKKKGIGYSSDNQSSSKWSTTQWIEYRKIMNEEIQRIASIFVSFLDCEKPLTDPKLSQIIKNSCLLPLIESALRSGSLLDISKESDLFRSYLNIIRSMANNPATADCLLPLDPKYKPAQTESISKLLTKLHGIAEIFIDCLKSGKGGSENESAAIIATQIEKTYYLMEKAVRNISRKKDTIGIKEINSMPPSEAYRYLLGGLRFGYIDIRKTPGKDQYAHFYSTSIPKGAPPTPKILRLSQELADLSSSLPCEITNSIFVRCDKTRIDVIKILIMGSKDTPYSNGAFMFDLFCDDTYPNNPPKMSITTTGGGKIRFNPNLYSCGKVCLSLLGTWRGQASQNWDAKISTLLQLFISTQGMTMSEDLYFNEPGFDSQQGTIQGQKKNEAYSNIVKIGNIRYAMSQQIRNPPKGFEEVIHRHFYVKKKQILQQIQKWIEQADTKQANYTGLVNDHNTSFCNELKVKGKYKQILIKQYEELKTLLDKLPQPNLQQKQQQISIESQKLKKKAKAKEVKLGEIDVSYDPSAEKQLSYEESVMQDRWSRYIGAMGIQAVKKQAQSKVVLIGLKPLGLEIAKNLVLSGLKELFIVDQSTYEFGSQEHFYMSDVKSKKIEQCIHKVKELNPYMHVKYGKEIPNIQNYHVVICTQPLSNALEISKKCRKLGLKFIYAQSCGVSGIYFADLGKQFSIQDPTGEEPFEGMIKQITCDKEGVVKLLDGVKHPYQDGDYIVIDQVDGMKQKQTKMEEPSPAQVFYNKMVKSGQTNSINGKVFQIKVINWNSFSIGDTTNFEPYIKNGICKNINIPKTISYTPLEESINKFEQYLDPSVGIYDFEKMGDNYSVWACFKAYSEFIEKTKRKPKNWQVKDVQQFQVILKNILTNDKKTQEQIQSILKFGRKYSIIAEAELPVIGAYFGGLVSQQVVKAITNKYTPIKQFFTFHFNELMQEMPENWQHFKNLQVKETETFPNLKIVIGRENTKKIEQMKTFVIGAGAIGCELLKNFAMINMGAEGMITITDPDHIETSNLTRQFLFRQKHVKKPKSATAAATLIQMNPNLKNHISARLDKVSEQTQDIYSDEFFESQTVIANALDNVKARVYVDSRCVINSKPLFESGTLGPKGHVQVIVPHKTQNYGNQADPTQQNQIPHCTLKMFPEETVHCIEWSRDLFGKIFTLNPKALKKVIQAKDMSAAEGQQKSTVAKMIEHKPSTFDDCVAEAARKFYKYFRNSVRQLLHTYPLNMKDKQGKLFWTLPKRPPKQIKDIDFSDPIHQKFLASYAVLLAKIYRIPYPKDFRQKEGIQKIMQFAKSVKPQQFIPSEEQSQKLQKMTEKEEKNIMTQESQQATVQQPKQQQKQIKINLTQQILELDVKPQEFEKDEDQNGHIDLIYSMSNLRARNYGLNECTWIEAKLKAGKIMAALSTTTSVVAALQTVQIIKLVVGSKQYRNAFVNLAIPLIQISEPGQVPKHKIGNTEFSVWDTWEFKAKSLKDLLKQVQSKYDVQGYNLSTAGGVPLYWQAMYVGKQDSSQELLNKPLNKLFQGKTTLNILMRSKIDKKPYEHVPRVVVQPTFD